MSQQVCYVCQGTALTEDNGILVCAGCGTQSQATVEENEYAEQGLTNRRRYAGATRIRGVEQALKRHDPAQTVKSCARAYLLSLQTLLQAQCRRLVDAFGVHSDVVPLVRHLWLGMVPHLGLLDFDPANRRKLPKRHDSDDDDDDNERDISTSERGSSGGSSSSNASSSSSSSGTDSGVGDDISADEGWAARRRRRKKRQRSPAFHLAGTIRFKLPHKTHWDQTWDSAMMKRVFQKDVPPQLTLGVCYLACVLLRAAIMPSDIVRWALDGDLPYLDLVRYATADRGDPQAADASPTPMPLAALPAAVLEVSIVVSPHGLMRSAGAVVRLLRQCQGMDVVVPNVHAEAVLWRLNTELALPRGIYDVAVELYRLYLVDTPVMNIMCMDSLMNPYLALAGLLVCALRLAYGLDGPAAPLLPHLPPPPISWPDWAQHQMRHVSKIANQPLSVHEVMKLDGAERADYITFCRARAFAAYRPPEAVEALRDMLDNLVEAARQQGEGATPAASGRHAEGVATQLHAQELMKETTPLTRREHMHPDLVAVLCAVAAHMNLHPLGIIHSLRAYERHLSAADRDVMARFKHDEMAQGAEEEDDGGARREDDAGDRGPLEDEGGQE